MYDHTLFFACKTHQSRYQVTSKMGCQPGGCGWLLLSSSGVCVGMYGLPYSLYHPRGQLTLEHKLTSVN